MGWWRTFLDSLDSNGGHIVLLFALMGFGIYMIHISIMEGGTVVGGSFGALLMMLKANGSNRDQSGGSTTSARVETVTPPDVTVT